jgi:phosphohistidine swiveling domain-containing protein
MSDMVQSFQELAIGQHPLAGGKGGSLARLFQAGYPVPDGFVVLAAGAAILAAGAASMSSAFDGERLTAEAWAQVQVYLAGLRAAGRDVAFAVRSSALSEDSAQASFAGEFETVLNVRTDEEIHQAIHTVYHSRRSERVQAYSQVKGIGGAHEIAVIVQQLVRADSSGVLFTADPVTGSHDQAIINAAWGMGEAIVGGLVTPDTLCVDKTSGRIIRRETADKQLMTVLGESGTQEQPVPEALRHAPVLSDAQAAELVRLGTRIETLYGLPMDVEWVLAGQTFFIVQARPITALPAPEAPPPSEWKLPKGVYAAMRNNIVELMAQPLTPLFGSLGRAAINTSLGRLLAAFFGRPGMMPEEIIITVNEYAYYNGSLEAGPIVRILWDSVGIARRMFTGAVERWTGEGRPRYVASVERWQAQPWQELPATGLVNAARELAEAAIDAYGALLSGVIPAAWISEALFTGVYDRLIKRRGDPPAPTYLLGFDSVPIRAEKSLYDLAEWVRTRAAPTLAAYLKDTPSPRLAAQLSNDQAPPGVDGNDWGEFRSRFQAHLQSYGHTIYDLDFANPVPADDPAPLLDTCKLFVSGQGVDPHAPERREQAVQAVMDRLKGLRLRLFAKFLAPAQRYAPLREDGLADVGLGYPLLRQMLGELGRRFAAAGTIETPDDIFWLEQAEVEQAAARLDRGEVLDCLGASVSQRKANWRAARRVSPPMMLPQMKFLGVDLGALKAGRKRQRGDSLKGVATSPGRVTAPARVLTGPEDFGQMRPGEVLVASITTPAWTPLFAMASAVVTDVGGPLSHGSIVAREYGIPAVLGTGVATARIRSGQIITVDGSAGVVSLPKDGD